MSQKSELKIFFLNREFISRSLRIYLFFFPVGVPVKVTNLKEGITKDSALDIFLYLNDVG